MQPEIIMEWEPPEAANPSYFYDLKPGDKKQAGLWVKPKFPGAGSFRVRVAGQLPDWLKVSPVSFNPPVKLTVEVDATNIDVEKGNEWRGGFDLGFVLDE